MSHRAEGNWDLWSCSYQGAAQVELWCSAVLLPVPTTLQALARHRRVSVRSLAWQPGFGEVSCGEQTGDSFLPGHCPNTGMSQG